MEVAGKMEIDLLHREYLCISASCSSTLHAETWTEGRFTQGKDRLLADLVHAKGKSYRNGSLADAGLGRGDGSHENKITILYLLFIYERDIHLGHMASIMSHMLLVDAIFTCKLLYLFQLYATCNFNVRFHFQ